MFHSDTSSVPFVVYVYLHACFSILLTSKKLSHDINHTADLWRNCEEGPGHPDADKYQQYE